MGEIKTPGVYIEENSALPNSIIEVPTAVPAFIGYTEKADNEGEPLLNKPWRINSISEYHNYFGFGPSPIFTINEKAADSTEEGDFTQGEKEYALNQSAGKNLLYYSLELFFQNGGESCYIVSVGDYNADVEADKLQSGISLLVEKQEPTMVVIPETVLLDEENSISIQQAALAHCGGKMKNRVAILDIWGGEKDRQDPSGDCIEKFRSALGINYLDFATAYYPWLNTTIVQDNELNYENIGNADVLQTLLKTEIGIPDTMNDTTPTKVVQQAQAIANITSTWDDAPPDEVAVNKDLLNKSLIAMSPLFGIILSSIKRKLNLLPPAAAMAGVYTMVDNSRGVWKAPANVSLSAVISPTVNITNDEQEDLNVTTHGKSINAIRTFIDKGTLVWGARTLDGNSLDWRYISVRRTVIMLEESIRLATKAYVFEPNDSSTWVMIKGMISNFLTSIWRRGGLAGSVPSNAFSVHIGLGDTMTYEDISEGIIRVTVLVAISRPAEFVKISFEQQMQKS